MCKYYYDDIMWQSIEQKKTFKMTPLSDQKEVAAKNKKVYGDFAMQTTWMYPADNVGTQTQVELYESR